MTAARGVVLIVADGNRGSEFSVSAARELLLQLPDVLRSILSEIEQDIARDVAHFDKIAGENP